MTAMRLWAAESSHDAGPRIEKVQMPMRGKECVKPPAVSHRVEKMSDTVRIVVKVGTSTLTYENGKTNLHRMEQICRVLSDLQNRGKEIILVSSGAIGIGVGKLGLNSKPAETEKKQALAAIGQCELMFLYDKFFGEYNQTVAQLLLTKNVTDTARGKANVQNTFRELIGMGVIPVVNENDTVDTAELEGANYGDNDMLSAIVAEIVGADALIILTDTEGLFDSDPHTNPDAKIIRRVSAVGDEIQKLCGDSGSNRGTGGMITKIHAAKYATEAGIATYIVGGSKPRNLYDILSGKEVGTYFSPVLSGKGDSK